MLIPDLFRTPVDIQELEIATHNAIQPAILEASIVFVASSEAIEVSLVLRKSAGIISGATCKVRHADLTILHCGLACRRRSVPEDSSLI